MSKLVSSSRRGARRPDLSLVVPTYCERENIERLLKELFDVFGGDEPRFEVIVVDDASPDGTGDFVDDLAKTDERIRLIRRAGKLGLTSAVIDGFAIARGEILGVMDADLSHPPSALPRMLETVHGGADFVIGSRYVEGGGTKGWPVRRRFMSWVACQLARPFTQVKDPMSGFFLIRRECFERVDLTAKGFKVVLDLLVNAPYEKVVEVPITFVDRQRGQSKISRREVLNLLRSLAGYAVSGAKSRSTKAGQSSPARSRGEHSRYPTSVH